MNMLVTAAAAAASAIAVPSPSQGRVSVEVVTPALDPEALPSLQEDSFPEYPPEIFGKLPDGFVLEEQMIEMLCFWHRKAIEVIAGLPDDGYAGPGTTTLDDFCMVKNRILRAVLSKPAALSRQVAAQLRTVVAEIECLKTDSIEEVLDVDDIIKLAGELTKATAPLVPKKHVGALHRGRKLTRAGLLTRYQSFLVQELETVSWNLYGTRDYAKHVIFFDDAVRDRCLSTDRCYPFFDERGLTTRARAVLESLKIDTEASERRL